MRKPGSLSTVCRVWDPAKSVLLIAVAVCTVCTVVLCASPHQTSSPSRSPSETKTMSPSDTHTMSQSEMSPTDTQTMSESDNSPTDTHTMSPSDTHTVTWSAVVGTIVSKTRPPSLSRPSLSATSTHSFTTSVSLSTLCSSSKSSTASDTSSTSETISQSAGSSLSTSNTDTQSAWQSSTVSKSTSGSASVSITHSSSFSHTMSPSDTHTLSPSDTHTVTWSAVVGTIVSKTRPPSLSRPSLSATSTLPITTSMSLSTLCSASKSSTASDTSSTSETMSQSAGSSLSTSNTDTQSAWQSSTVSKSSSGGITGSESNTFSQTTWLSASASKSSSDGESGSASESRTQSDDASSTPSNAKTVTPSPSLSLSASTSASPPTCSRTDTPTKSPSQTLTASPPEGTPTISPTPVYRSRTPISETVLHKTTPYITRLKWDAGSRTFTPQPSVQRTASFSRTLSASKDRSSTFSNFFSQSVSQSVSSWLSSSMMSESLTITHQTPSGTASASLTGGSRSGSWSRTESPSFSASSQSLSPTTFSAGDLRTPMLHTNASFSATEWTPSFSKSAHETSSQSWTKLVTCVQIPVVTFVFPRTWPVSHVRAHRTSGNIFSLEVRYWGQAVAIVQRRYSGGTPLEREIRVDDRTWIAPWIAVDSVRNLVYLLLTHYQYFPKANYDRQRQWTDELIRINTTSFPWTMVNISSRPTYVDDYVSFARRYMSNWEVHSATGALYFSSGRLLWSIPFDRPLSSATVVAGNERSWSDGDDGIGSNATFSFIDPNGMCFDSNERYLYVRHMLRGSYDYRIRRISLATAQVVTVVRILEEQPFNFFLAWDFDNSGLVLVAGSNIWKVALRTLPVTMTGFGKSAPFASFPTGFLWAILPLTSQRPLQVIGDAWNRDGYYFKLLSEFRCSAFEFDCTSVSVPSIVQLHADLVIPGSEIVVSGICRNWSSMSNCYFAGYSGYSWNRAECSARRLPNGLVAVTVPSVKPYEELAVELYLFSGRAGQIRFGTGIVVRSEWSRNFVFAVLSVAASDATIARIVYRFADLLDEVLFFFETDSGTVVADLRLEQVRSTAQGGLMNCSFHFDLMEFLRLGVVTVRMQGTTPWGQKLAFGKTSIEETLFKAAILALRAKPQDSARRSEEAKEAVQAHIIQKILEVSPGNGSFKVPMNRVKVRKHIIASLNSSDVKLPKLSNLFKIVLRLHGMNYQKFLRIPGLVQYAPTVGCILLLAYDAVTKPPTTAVTKGMCFPSFSQFPQESDRRNRGRLFSLLVDCRVSVDGRQPKPTQGESDLYLPCIETQFFPHLSICYMLTWRGTTTRCCYDSTGSLNTGASQPAMRTTELIKKIATRTLCCSLSLVDVDSLRKTLLAVIDFLTSSDFCDGNSPMKDTLKDIEDDHADLALSREANSLTIGPTDPLVFLWNMSRMAYCSPLVDSTSNLWDCGPICNAVPVKLLSVAMNVEFNAQALIVYVPSRNALVVTFRGTVINDLYFRNIRKDFSFVKYSGEQFLSCSELNYADCDLHAGFAKTYNSIRYVLRLFLVMRERYPQATVFVTGHSLGGALALLFAVDLLEESKYRAAPFRFQLTTFGQPKVGSSGFNRYVNTLFRRYGITYIRVVNEADVVPLVPPTTPLAEYSHPSCAEIRSFYKDTEPFRASPILFVSLSLVSVPASVGTLLFSEARFRLAGHLTYMGLCNGCSCDEDTPKDIPGSPIEKSPPWICLMGSELRDIVSRMVTGCDAVAEPVTVIDGVQNPSLFFGDPYLYTFKYMTPFPFHGLGEFLYMRIATDPPVSALHPLQKGLILCHTIFSPVNLSFKETPTVTTGFAVFVDTAAETDAVVESDTQHLFWFVVNGTNVYCSASSICLGNGSFALDGSTENWTMNYAQLNPTEGSSSSDLAEDQDAAAAAPENATSSVHLSKAEGEHPVITLFLHDESTIITITVRSIQDFGYMLDVSVTTAGVFGGLVMHGGRAKTITAANGTVLNMTNDDPKIFEKIFEVGNTWKITDKSHSMFRNSSAWAFTTFPGVNPAIYPNLLPEAMARCGLTPNTTWNFDGDNTAFMCAWDLSATRDLDAALETRKKSKAAEVTKFYSTPPPKWSNRGNITGTTVSVAELTNVTVDCACETFDGSIPRYTLMEGPNGTTTQNASSGIFYFSARFSQKASPEPLRLLVRADDGSNRSTFIDVLFFPFAAPARIAAEAQSQRVASNNTDPLIWMYVGVGGAVALLVVAGCAVLMFFRSRERIMPDKSLRLEESDGVKEQTQEEIALPAEQEPALQMRNRHYSRDGVYLEVVGVE